MFDIARAINPAKMQWHLRVRMLRMWTMSTYDSGRDVSSLEMILRDKEGAHIHATVHSSFIHKKCLEEGNACVISHFNVYQNTGSYSTTYHPYRVYFMYITTITPLDDGGCIHKYGFAFRAFTQVLAP